MSQQTAIPKALFLAAVLLVSGSRIPCALAHDIEGRMTGGGSIVCNGVQVTHGFELHCDNNDGTIPEPNSLEINFSGGNNFHLYNHGGLAAVDCIDDPSLNETPPVAGFDTITGTGFGSFNQEPARIEFTLTDNGEPGGGVDTASFTITVLGSNEIVLSCTNEFLEQGGNHQAHRATGSR